MNWINRIRKWNDIANVVPGPESEALYLKLMEEEWDEFWTAFENKDRIEMFDGAIDLVWVTIGFCRAANFNIDAGFGEVDYSNYSKFITSGFGPFKKYKCIKREDGKIMKPATYTPPNLDGTI